jgi:ribosomal protein S18 acetylase RimI-like enzyme
MHSPERSGQLLVRVADSPGDVATVRELWQEYWKSINLPNDFQGFGEEVKGLPGVYGEDGGALLLAWSATTAVGTIALRRLNDRSGEIKRLYLRPASRGQGLGRQLLEQVIERARELKYQSLYADTLPSMNEALSLYARLGFERVEAYASNPTPGAIFLELQLR